MAYNRNDGLIWFLKDKFNEPEFDYKQFVKNSKRSLLQGGEMLQLERN